MSMSIVSAQTKGENPQEFQKPRIVASDDGQYTIDDLLDDVAASLEWLTENGKAVRKSPLEFLTVQANIGVGVAANPRRESEKKDPDDIAIAKAVEAVSHVRWSEEKVLARMSQILTTVEGTSFTDPAELRDIATNELKKALGLA